MVAKKKIASTRKPLAGNGVNAPAPLVRKRKAPAAASAPLPPEIFPTILGGASSASSGGTVRRRPSWRFMTTAATTFALAMAVMLANQRWSTPTAFSQTPPTPVAKWDFSQVDGNTVADASGNNNTATLNNATGTNGALQLTGTDSFATVANASSIGITGDMTLSAWVKVDDFDFWRGLVSKSTNNIPNPFDWYLVMNTGKPIFYVGNGIQYTAVRATTAPAVGQWQHLAVVRSGSTVTHYLNGQPNGTGTLPTVPITNNSKPLYIGSRDDKFTKMKGSMDDVTMYNTALSAAEIADLSNNGRGLNPVGQWDFEEVDGTTAVDSSGNGNNGTLQGGASRQQGALQNSATGDFVNIGDPSSLQPAKVSVAAWFKTDSSGMIVRKRLYGYGLEILASKQVSFWIFNSAAAKFSAISPNNYADNVWHQAVGVYDGSTVRLWIDGTLVATASAGPIYYRGGAVAIGRDGDANGEYLKGMIDDVKIYNRALTDSEAVALAGVARTGAVDQSANGLFDFTAVGLVGQWMFENGSLNDNKQHRDATNNGAVATTDRKDVANNAYQFTSSAHQYINAGVVDAYKMSQAVTMESWIYPTGAGGQATYGGIIMNREGEYELARFENGHIEYALANTTPGWVWVDTGYVAPLNTWVHLVLTYSATDRAIVLYANGQEVYRHASASGAIGDYPPNVDLNEFRIGGRQYANVQNFDGKIDTVRIYNKALSKQEVERLYTAETVMVQQTQASSAQAAMAGQSMSATAFTAPQLIVEPDRLQFFASEGDKWEGPTDTRWTQQAIIELENKAEFVKPSVRSLRGMNWIRNLLVGE